MRALLVVLPPRVSDNLFQALGDNVFDLLIGQSVLRMLPFRFLCVFDAVNAKLRLGSANCGSSIQRLSAGFQADCLHLVWPFEAVSQFHFIAKVGSIQPTGVSKRGTFWNLLVVVVSSLGVTS